MTDKAREEFETAFRSAGQFKAMSSAALDSMLERGSDGEYRSVRVHGAWWGWQASRAALVIELPKIINKDWACDSSECEFMRGGINLTRLAILKAGVQVKL